MAQIHCVIDQLPNESEHVFKQRCANAALSVKAPGALAVGRMTLTGSVLALDERWDASQPGLPGTTCVIASYRLQAARLPAHPYDARSLESAPRNPQWARLAGVFHTPFDQHRGRDGQMFDLLSAITRPDARHDAEVLPMFVVRFADGETIEAWPEELCGPEVTEFVALVGKHVLAAAEAPAGELIA